MGTPPPRRSERVEAVLPSGMVIAIESVKEVHLPNGGLRAAIMVSASFPSGVVKTDWIILDEGPPRW
jgi:uncharacterized protein YabE (DUF348 family)